MNQVTNEEKEFLTKSIMMAYDKGYSMAVENIKLAMNLVPVRTLSKEHIFKLIDIVQKVLESK